MEDIFKTLSSVIITVTGTVTSGVVVFIVGQILTTVWLQPLQKYKDIKQRIAEKLSYYARYYTNVIDLANSSEKEIEAYCNAADDLRKLASELTGFIETLSWIKIGIPKKEDLLKATEDLFALSNSFFSPYNIKPEIDDNIQNRDTANEIRKLLNMYYRKKSEKKR